MSHLRFSSVIYTLVNFLRKIRALLVLLGTASQNTFGRFPSQYHVAVTVFLGYLRKVNSLRKIRPLLVLLGTVSQNTFGRISVAIPCRGYGFPRLRTLVRALRKIRPRHICPELYPKTSLERQFITCNQGEYQHESTSFRQTHVRQVQGHQEKRKSYGHLLEG